MRIFRIPYSFKFHRLWLFSERILSMTGTAVANDEPAEVSSINNGRRDLEANNSSTAVELRQPTAHTTLRQRRHLPPPSHEVKALEDEPCLAFFPRFQDQAAQDRSPYHCLFVCWGPSGDHYAIDIPVDDKDNEAKIYRDMQKQWRKKRGFWRHFLPFRGIVAVREIKVSSIVMQSPKSFAERQPQLRFINAQKGRFAVLVRSLEKENDQLQRQLENNLFFSTVEQEGMAEMEIAPNPECCYFDGKTGEYIHFSKCPVNDHFTTSSHCPFQKNDTDQRQLRSLRLQPLLTACFKNPEYAAGNHTLESLTYGSVIHRYS